MDVDMLVIEIQVTSFSSLNLRAFSHYCPRMSVSIPEAFSIFFGKKFLFGWVQRLTELIGDEKKYKLKPRKQKG